jgi:hypothetical protein
MTWELGVTLAIVMIAAGYVLRAGARALFGKGRGGCGSGCGKCDSTAKSVPGRINLPQV